MNWSLDQVPGKQRRAAGSCRYGEHEQRHQHRRRGVAHPRLGQHVGPAGYEARGAGQPEDNQQEEEREHGVLVAGHLAQLGVARVQQQLHVCFGPARFNIRAQIVTHLENLVIT